MTVTAPFAHRGVPVVCPGRGHWASLEGHTRHDTIDTISPQTLYEMAEFSVRLIGRFVNVPEFPIPREIPKEYAAELAEMFDGSVTG